MSRTRGVTLIETLAAMAVLSLAASVAIGTMGSALPATAKLQNPIVAQDLARGLLDEALSRSFNDPLGTDGETSPPSGPRTGLDDTDDYNGYRDGPPVDPTGTPMSGRTGYARAVRVVPVTEADPNVLTASRSNARLLRVEVDASWDGGRVTLVGLKALDTPGILPFPRSGLVYVEGSRGDGNSEHLVFQAVNRTGRPLPVDGITVSWRDVECDDEEPLYFKEVEISKTVLAQRNPLFAESERIALSAVTTFQPGAPREVRIDHFRKKQNGTGPAGHVRDLEFTILAHSGTRTYQLEIPVDNSCGEDEDHH